MLDYSQSSGRDKSAVLTHPWINGGGIHSAGSNRAKGRDREKGKRIGFLKKVVPAQRKRRLHHREENF